jgi:DNA-binding response OmpR family regulator
MLKILLVDDDPTMLDLLKALLTMEGYQVAMLSNDSGDILKNTLVEKPDFMLMDVFMGEQHGLNIVRQIRQVQDLNRMKIVMVGGMDQSAESLAAGAEAFLVKPYDPDELLGILRSD